MPALANTKRTLLLLLLVFSAGQIVLHHTTALDINSTPIFFLLVFLAVSSMLLLVGQYLLGGLSKAVVLLIYLSVFGGCFAVAVITWKGVWKTQTILYRNNENPSETIEYRMRTKRYSFDFERQIVQRKSILPYLDLIAPADTAQIDKTKWRFENVKVNEMGFSGEYIDLPE
ncbi:hypothetical protein FLLO111716_10930 [Flavobacterium longum]|uniref:hypothetical protein n=1 Tax=Flavobacterium longum TaxID=1299340 RepID=UPI0039EBFFF1